MTVDCTLVLRHETGRAPDTEYPSLTRIGYVESSRVVRRPAHGTATETLECDECGRPVAFTVFSRRRTRGWRTAWWVLLLTLIIVPLVMAVMFASMFFVSGPGVHRIRAGLDVRRARRRRPGRAVGAEEHRPDEGRTHREGHEDWRATARGFGSAHAFASGRTSLRCAERCRQLGVDLADDAFLFSPAPDGSTPFVPRSLTQRYRRLAQRLKLRSTRLHYSATELIAAGVDVRTVAGRLGHGSGGATTLKVYAAWVDEADRRAAKTMATVMPKPEPVSPRPRGPYESIAADLRTEIEAGRLKPGDQMPTIVQLAASYSVAAGTAHRAMTRLQSEGLIEARRGSRAVVSAHRLDPQEST